MHGNVRSDCFGHESNSLSQERKGGTFNQFPHKNTCIEDGG